MAVGFAVLEIKTLDNTAVDIYMDHVMAIETHEDSKKEGNSVTTTHKTVIHLKSGLMYETTMSRLEINKKLSKFGWEKRL